MEYLTHSTAAGIPSGYPEMAFQLKPSWFFGDVTPCKLLLKDADRCRHRDAVAPIAIRSRIDRELLTVARRAQPVTSPFDLFGPRREPWAPGTLGLPCCTLTSP